MEFVHADANQVIDLRDAALSRRAQTSRHDVHDALDEISIRAVLLTIAIAVDAASRGAAGVCEPDGRKAESELSAGPVR